MREAQSVFYPSVNLEAGETRSRSAKTTTSSPSVQNTNLLMLSTAFEDVWGQVAPRQRSGLGPSFGDPLRP